MTIHVIKLFFLLVLLLSFPGALKAQSKDYQYRARLRDSVDHAQPDTLKITLLLKLGNDYREENKNKIGLDTALRFVQRALRLARLHGNLLRIGDCYELVSSIYERQNNLIQARIYQNIAIGYFQRANNLAQTGDAYRKLGRTYDYQDSKELAERIKCDSLGLICYVKTDQWLKQGYTLESLGDLHHVRNEASLGIIFLKGALVAYEKAHFKSVQGVYYYLTCCYEMLGDLHQALSYGLSAIRVAEAVKDSSDMPAMIYNYVGKTYKKIGQLDKAIEYYQVGLQFENRYHHTNNLLGLSNNLAHSLISIGKVAVAIRILNDIKTEYPEDRYVLTGMYLYAYLTLKDYHKADRYYKQAIILSDKLDKFDSHKIFIYPIIIRYLFETRQFDQARLKVADMEENYLGNHNKQGLVLSHHWLFRLDSAGGNLLSAIKHNQAEQLIRDILMNEAKIKSISQLEVAYETEKKDHQLRLKNQNIQLLTNQGQLQKASLQKVKLIRNVTIGGSVLLMVLLLVSVSRYQLKQRSNLQLLGREQVINKKNSALEQLIGDKDALLREKEWLLKEIHHRVKNNLQIVISLLNSQSSYLDNDTALSAIRESQHRMHSISLIHQKLYQSDNLAQIDMVDYIVELTDYLQESFGTGKRIEMNLLIEPISLDVAQAVPVGLILNEAITNAIKYAFKAGVKGMITIALDEPKPNFIMLTITDNGDGLPAGFDIDTSKSLGMSLMKGLSRQLHGDFSLTNSNGLTLKLLIPTNIMVSEETLMAI
jgi:two-component sensor histidine kinase/TPR repeat protein